MIVLNLVCHDGHKFEGWFSSVESFDIQVREELVSCPHCSSQRIERVPAAPHLARKASESSGSGQAAPGLAGLIEFLGALADASEDVGRSFPEEARRIHYRETGPRSIRGQTTAEEAHELLEEGIPVLPVPFKPRTH